MSGQSGRATISVPDASGSSPIERSVSPDATVRPDSQLRSVAANDCDVVAVAAGKDMGRASPLQPPDKADLVVELRPESIDEDRRQSGLLGGDTDAFRQFAAVDRAVVDDGEELAFPEPRQQTPRCLALAVGTRPEPVDRPAGPLSAVGQAVGTHADGYRWNIGFFQDRQRRLARLAAKEANHDLNLCCNQFARCPRAALCRASIVGDAEPDGGIGQLFGRHGGAGAHLFAKKSGRSSQRRRKTYGGLRAGVTGDHKRCKGA